MYQVSKYNHQRVSSNDHIAIITIINIFCCGTPLDALTPNPLPPSPSLDNPRTPRVEIAVFVRATSLLHLEREAWSMVK